jgi:hypothetical protein
MSNHSGVLKGTIRRWSSVQVAIVLGVLLASSIAALPSLARLAPVGGGDREPATGLAAGTGELQAAAHSLTLGAGPAAGSPWSCGGSSGSTLSCSPPTSAGSGGASPPHPLTNTLPDWTSDPQYPTGRWLAMMAYDPVDKYVVLFGGENPGFLGDTWTYSGAWTQLHPATSPAARSGGQMAFDYKDGYVVLFGGLAASGVQTHDTWKFLHGAWTLLHPATAPPGVYGASFVWDVNDSYLLLFGGYNSSTGFSSATWSFVGGAWTLLHPALAPSARYFAQAGYDNTNGWVVLFGGGNFTAVLSDTWNYSRGHWTQLHPARSPTGVSTGSLSNDSADGYLVLFGGETLALAPSSATWSFVNRTWTQITTASPPSGRASPAVAYDGALKKLLLFGGEHEGGYLNSTWTYHNRVWTDVVTGPPIAVVGGMMTYDEADGYVLYFGGGVLHGTTTNTLLTPSAETWTFSKDHWTELHPSTSPAARFAAGMTYDGADQYVVLFGGGSAAGYLNDTWSFHAGKWTQVISPSVPGGRELPGMTYDAADGYVVLFGGTGFPVPGSPVVDDLNDTWLFQGGQWTEWVPPNCKTCAPNPSGREAPSMAYDPVDGYVLMFGGQNDTPVAKSLNDTWTFLAGTWTNITVPKAVVPSVRADAQLVYDDTDGYMLLVGGVRAVGTALGDTWSFLAGTWTLLSPANAPAPDYLASMAFDAQDSTVVYLGGFVHNEGTWLY